MREEEPQVVLAYDETGGYGHPDHVKAHEVTVAAVAACSPAPRLYFVRFPLAWSRRFVQALRAAGIEAPASAAAGADAGPGILEIGVPDELVTTRIDVREFVGIKRAALACHASQLAPAHFLRRMSDGLAAELWATECFSRADAPPGSFETDLFAGLP
jgi:LmbE family N-acetylglucosaminyl deacetylase